MSPIDSHPHVLVLLACRNGSAWIEAQVVSILQQHDVRISLVVSDDGSSDGTAELIEALCLSDARVSVLTRHGASGSAGANFRRLFRQVRLAGVDFVAFADQDDLWLPDKLAVATRLLRDSKADGYSSAVKAFWEDGRERILAQEPRQRDADFLFEGAGQGCTFVLTCELFQFVQDFCLRHPREADELHYHDWLVYALARCRGSRWLFDETPRILYRQHQSNEIGARGGMGATARRFEKIRDGWFKAQVLAAIAVSTKVADNDAVALYASLLKPGSGRLKLAKALLQSSRRRLSDRLVLVVAALFGWL